jgi:hypothetical protein
MIATNMRNPLKPIRSTAGSLRTSGSGGGGPGSNSRPTAAPKQKGAEHDEDAASREHHGFCHNLAEGGFRADTRGKRRQAGAHPSREGSLGGKERAISREHRAAVGALFRLGRRQLPDDRCFPLTLGSFFLTSAQR